jgi:predicted acetyltransferase
LATPTHFVAAGLRTTSDLNARRRISSGGRGYATRALRLLLPHARAEGLAHIDLTTTADNIASQRVIEANGRFLVERFRPPPAYGRDEGLRFRIVLTDRLG